MDTSIAPRSERKVKFDGGLRTQKGTRLDADLADSHGRIWHLCKTAPAMRNSARRTLQTALVRKNEGPLQSTWSFSL